MFKKKSKKTTSIADMQNHIEKEREKTVLKTKEKTVGPKTLTAMKMIQTVIYGFFLVVFLVGLWQVVRPKVPVEQVIEYRYIFNYSESEMAKSFAESFVRDYLTYVPGENTYQQKMDVYLASGITLGRAEASKGESKVVDTMIWSVEVIDENRSNITVKADVEITNYGVTEMRYNPETGEREELPTVTQKIDYVVVPIYATAEGVIINDYPVFAAAPKELDMSMDYADTEGRVNDETNRSIKEMLTDFYGVYYEGTEGQIKSFLKEDINLQGMEGSFTFDKIESIGTFNDGDIYTAVVVVDINQADINTPMVERHIFTIEQASDRWVIVTMKNRGVNYETGGNE